VLWIALLALLSPGGPAAASAEEGVIRLAPERPTAGDDDEATNGLGPSRQGFDYDAFVSRLESLWFQRKTMLASGREEDARAQLDQIRAFCAAEGVKRLEHFAGALVAEAYRYHHEGNDAQALSALEFAAAFDPHRPQIHVARATVLWRSGHGPVAASRELWHALEASAVQSLQQLSLLPRLAFVLGLACIGAALTFGLVMLLRYQAPLRHEIEEVVRVSLGPPWPEIAGWTALALPLLTWYAAGWSVLLWVVACFRFMSRREKLATVTLLMLGALTMPAYTFAVSLYGTSADPAVRTTVAAVEGEYDPDRIVRLRQLVEAHPDDPSYHFLLAGLYKNGRYFEEAFGEYRVVLELDPAFTAARINIGNIFYATGQYPAAMTEYRKALEHDPDAFLAHYNLHLAQSENFHFGEAEESLQRAREIDAERVSDLLGRSGNFDQRAEVQDAALQITSVWEAAVGGRSPTEPREAGLGATLWGTSSPFNAFTVLCLLGVGTCLVSSGLGAMPARRCIRCGRPYCSRCKSAREAQEYCSQCLHLYVLRDGLEPETKGRKLYEVQQHELRSRRVRRLLGLLAPGSALLLRGLTWRGVLLLVVWFALLVSAVPEVLTPDTNVDLGLSTDLLLAAEVPMRFDPHPGRYAAMLLVPFVWLVGNWPQRSRKEA
jgi:tetratricopeptide (TPR) repeat protein